MRFGLITTSFPRFDGDIPGQFVFGFAQMLVRAGHTVHVLAPEPPEDSRLRGSQAEPRADWQGIDRTWVPYVRPRRLQQTFYGAGAPENLARVGKVRKAALLTGAAAFVASASYVARRRCCEWDAVVSHWSVPCGAIAAVTGLPHVCVFHSGDVHALEIMPAGRSVARRIVRRSNALLFVSEDLRERLLRLLPAHFHLDVIAKSMVSPMGVHGAEGSERRTGFSSGVTVNDGDPLKLLVLSRLVPIKGIDTAIKAVARVSNATLDVVGDGPERKRLERLAERVAPGRVRFHGVLHRADKRKALETADALLVPSRVMPGGRTEGTPTAALEAFQYGLPVLASRVGGLPEVVRDGHNGFLLDEDDPAGWAARIRDVADANTQSQLRDGALETGGDFLWPRVGERLMPWIDSRLRA